MQTPSALLDAAERASERRPQLPGALARRFPRGNLLPLMPWPNIAPRGPFEVYNALTLFPRRVLVGVVFRFRGKRLRAADVERIELLANGCIVWSCDAITARAITAYRDGERAPRCYAFLEFGNPGTLPFGGLDLGRLSHVQARLALGPAVREPRIDWWAVLL